MPSKIPTRILIGMAIFICVVYLIISILYKPIVSNDALSGFVSLHNYLNGCKWNRTLGIDNAGAIYDKELTWWAPGQYQLPYTLSKFLGDDIGLAVSVLLFISIVSGALIYCRLFELYSTLPRRIVVISLLILLLQRFININFVQYTSSDLFLFLIVPLYIWVYLKIDVQNKPLKWYNFLILLVINLIGLYIKNSFLLFSLAFNAFLLVYILKRIKFVEKSASVEKLKRSIVLLPFVFSACLDYYCFLRLGTNPSNGAGIVINFSSIIQGFFQAMTGILLSSFSLTAMYGTLYNKISLSAPVLNIVMLGCSVLIFAVLYLNRKNIKSLLKKDLLFSLILVLGGMYTLYWLCFNIKQSFISNEDRLFLPITILVLPYIIQHISSCSSAIKNVCVLAVAVSILYGVGTMISRIIVYDNEKVSVISGDPKLKSFKIFSVDQPKLSELAEISRLITTHYEHQYLLTTDVNLFFLLKVNNQFILEQPQMSAFTFKGNKQYLLLVDVRNNSIPLSGWANIYKSANYNLFIY